MDLISDTHLDFFSDRDQVFTLLKAIYPGSDTLVIAGDFCEVSCVNYLDYLRTLCDKYKNVVYVFGNHEWYGLQFDYGQTQKKIQQMLHNNNLSVLENEKIVLPVDGKETEFVCASGFFPDSKVAQANKRYLNDFRNIDNYDPFGSNLSTRIFFQNNLLLPKTTEKRVVVTHHLPSMNSVPIRFIADPTNCYYNSNLLQLDYEIDYWLHGHTHDQFDYQQDLADNRKCRVVCNPSGYYCEPLFKTIQI